jgi:hypothetical protein
LEEANDPRENVGHGRFGREVGVHHLICWIGVANGDDSTVGYCEVGPFDPIREHQASPSNGQVTWLRHCSSIDPFMF